MNSNKQKETAWQKWVYVWNPYHPDKLKKSPVQPAVVQESHTRKRMMQGMMVFLIIFLGWSAVAPIDAGVHLPGTVKVSGNRKEIKHPSGGVITEILVEEGARVREGDILVRVNPLNTEASLSEAELDYLSSLAEESRLISQRDNLPQIEWSPVVLELKNTDPRMAEYMKVQQNIFESSNNERSGEVRILQQRLGALRSQLSQMRSVVGLRQEQLKTLSEEATNNRALAAEGFVPQASANNAERQKNDLLASISESVSDLSRVTSEISSTELEILQRQAVFRKELNERLTEVQRRRETMSSKVNSLKFDRSLAEVRAPVAGIVVGMKVNTVGGVIEPAALLMEVLPEGSNLIIEARVPPVLIDKVYRDMPTYLRFTAFNLNTTPVVDGKVKLVGADLLTPDRSDESEYYLAQVETTFEETTKLKGLVVQAGMPVDVIVRNGERTFMSYLVRPIADRFALAFKD
jgi:protease secretion system membrane fusion protein